MLKILAVAFLLTAPFKWVYVVDTTKCNGCANCLSHCPENAISMQGPDAYIDPELCTGCGNCANFCPRDAIYRDWYTGIEDEENTQKSVSFSRNPVCGSSVTVSGITPGSELRVIDNTGRVVFEGNADSRGVLTIDTSNIPENTYLVVTGRQSYTLTVI